MSGARPGNSRGEQLCGCKVESPQVQQNDVEVQLQALVENDNHNESHPLNTGRAPQSCIEGLRNNQCYACAAQQPSLCRRRWRLFADSRSIRLQSDTDSWKHFSVVIGLFIGS